MKEIALAASLNKRFAPIVFRPVEDEDLPEDAWRGRWLLTYGMAAEERVK